MALITTNNEHYYAIANAIRAKNGESATYLPSQMAQAILDLPSGGGRSPHAEVQTLFDMAGWTWPVTATEDV